MVNLVNLPSRWRKKGIVTFTRSEIGQLMSVYSLEVSKGNWKDYAIDSLANMAVFSIYKSAREDPIYSITKSVSQNAARTVKFSVYDGERMLKQSTSMLEILNIFKDDTKKKKK